MGPGNFIAADRALQLRAMATLSDGSQVDVSAKASWRSTNPDLAAVSASGAVQILTPGDVDVVATYETLNAIARIFTWELHLNLWDTGGDNLLFYRRLFPISIARTSHVTLSFSGTGRCQLQGTYTDTGAALSDGPSPRVEVFPYRRDSAAPGTPWNDTQSDTVKAGEYTLSIGFSYVWRTDCLLSVTLLNY
jgi:hypothetical protein